MGIYNKKRKMTSKEEINTDIDDKSQQEKQEDHKLPDASVEETDINSKLEAELTEARDKYLRLYSEFENYKKRVSRDRIEYSKLAGAEFFRSILPVIDDMERAMKSFEDAKEIASLKEGLSLIFSKIQNITAGKGLIPMESLNKPFDPELHDAISNAPVPSEDLKGKVIDEIEKGYYLNDRVIRHAKVIVGI
jgi:molecular chaperone GrpE